MADNTIYNITEDPFNAGSFSTLTGRNPETYTVSNSIPEHPAINGFQLQDRPDMATLRLIAYEAGDTFDTDTEEVDLEIITSGVPNYVQALVDATTGWVHLDSGRTGQDIVALYDSYGSNYNVSNVTGIVNDAVGTAIEEGLAAVITDSPAWTETDKAASARATDDRISTQIVANFQSDKRQVVYQGSVDANGQADYLTISGTGIVLDATPTPVSINFAAGFSGGRRLDYYATFEADQTPSAWDGGTTGDGTFYLLIDYNSGSPTFHTSTLRPVHGEIHPGTPSTDQHSYLINEGKNYRYTGSAWEEKQRVLVGKMIVSGGSPTSVITYALNGRYVSEWFSVGAASNRTKAHNIGVALMEGVHDQFYFSPDSAGADSSIAHDMTSDFSTSTGIGHYMRENVANNDTHENIRIGFLDYVQVYRSTTRSSGYYKIHLERLW